MSGVSWTRWIKDAIDRGWGVDRIVGSAMEDASPAVRDEWARRHLKAEVARVRRTSVRAIERSEAQRLRNARQRALVEARTAERMREFEAQNEERARRADALGISEDDLWDVEQAAENVAQRAYDQVHRYTVEFLATAFQLADGTEVQWGEATRDQHEARVAMLSKQATAIEEDIALHREVIAALDLFGVATLNDLREKAAA